MYSNFRFYFERVSGLVDISITESLSRTQQRNGLTQFYVIKPIRSRNRMFFVFTTLRSQAGSKSISNQIITMFYENLPG